MHRLEIKNLILFIFGPALALWGVIACQKSASAPVVSTLLAHGEPPCDIRLRIRELTNPLGQANANEQAFYSLVQAEGIDPKTAEIEGIRPSLDAWKNKIGTMACNRAKKAGCHLALISKNLKKALVTIQYAKYAHTLKVREVDGKHVIFVKGSGAKPERDPRQPDGVKERYENHYLWFFREKAGDLHPGFLWAALLNTNPSYLPPLCAEGTKFCKDPNYKRILLLWQEILKQGYISKVKRSPNEGAMIQDLYLVRPEKVADFKSDKIIASHSVRLFGNEEGLAFMNKINQLLSIRTNPILRANQNGKFQITEADMLQMKLDVPFVSLDGWSVVLVDHHRITAAHDLGMAIEVYAYHGFLSFN